MNPNPRYLAKAILYTVLLFMPFWAGAAQFRFSPSSGTFIVGNSFEVAIVLDTEGELINAFKVHFSFPPDKLQVVSPSTGQSITGVWTNFPRYDNMAGEGILEGGIPNGLNTSRGVIASLTFRARQVGTVFVRFLDDSQALLSDGKGTDALSGRQNGVYLLTLPPPSGPIVASETHSDQSRWYPNSNVLLRWVNINPVEIYSYVFNNEPTDLPDDIAEGANTSATYRNVTSGTYYFHVKAFRGNVWGGTTHFAVNVDTNPPADFPIDISPSAFTTSKNPVINFTTTDSNSGISHYEYKVITLSAPPQAGAEAQEFFVLVEPPKVLALEYGAYDILVRAYDLAGNFREKNAKIRVVAPITYYLANPLGIILAVVLLAAAVYALLHARKWHYLTAAGPKGAILPPGVKRKLEELRKYQDKYGKVLVILLMLGAWLGAPAPDARAQEAALNPPYVSQVSRHIANNEIFYIGGKTDAANTEVIIYLQNLRTGATLNQNVTSGKNGDWFYRHNTFLESGTYILWTQAESGDILSPPSPQIQMTVTPTAIQFGSSRLSYENVYLILVIMLTAVLLTILGIIAYHLYHGSKKRKIFMKEVREAEESVRKGFAVLKRDIEKELAVIRKAKLGKELSAQEKEAEGQLLKDLRLVEQYIGKEVWDIERTISG